MVVREDIRRNFRVEMNAAGHPLAASRSDSDDAKASQSTHKECAPSAKIIHQNHHL
jgi:hypothetical protein